jgi:SAM-dependent methyltransferase
MGACGQNSAVLCWNRPPLANRPPHRLDAWFETPAGRYALGQELRPLTALVRRAHGDTLLWLGSEQAMLPAIRGSLVRHRIYGARVGGASNPDRVDTAMHAEAERSIVQCQHDELPFANGSLDAVVLHHALDTAADPRSVLREATRTLAPGGRLIITAFNPLSLWGLRRLYAAAVPDAFRGLHMIAPFRLIDWLLLLGFELQAPPTYCLYGLASNRASSEQPPVEGGLEGWWVGRQWPVGGVQLISATKRAYASLVERRRAQRQPAAAFVRPAYNQHVAFVADPVVARNNVIRLPPGGQKPRVSD